MVINTYPQRRLLYIPTHRSCVPVIDILRREATFVDRQPNNQAVLCVIDTSGDPVLATKHQAALRRHVGVKFYLDNTAQQAFVDMLLANKRLAGFDQKRLRRLLLPAGISYGRGPNIASLVAAQLNCDSVHRRDSDIMLDPNRPNDMPIELELRAINQPIRTVMPPIRRVPQTVPAAAIVRAVGTGVFGAAAIDRRDLLAAGRQYDIQLQQLGRPGVPEAAVRKEAIHYLIKEPQQHYKTDFYEFDTRGRTEMDAYCYSTALTKLLPEMPTGILGCDYMLRDLAWRTGEAILFHSRKVHHCYDRQRLKQTDL